MKQVPDRKKLRREYLTKKARAYAGALLCTGLFLPVFLVTLALATAAVYVLVTCLRDTPLNYGLGAMICCLLLGGSALAGLFTWSLWQESARFIKVEANLPYVPPVTPDTLPADEILVRGSEEPPVAQSEVLLRAAQQGEETAKEELLRVSQE